MAKKFKPSEQDVSLFGGQSGASDYGEQPKKRSSAKTQKSKTTKREMIYSDNSAMFFKSSLPLSDKATKKLPSMRRKISFPYVGGVIEGYFWKNPFPEDSFIRVLSEVVKKHGAQIEKSNNFLVKISTDHTYTVE